MVLPLAVSVCAHFRGEECEVGPSEGLTEMGTGAEGKGKGKGKARGRRR